MISIQTNVNSLVAQQNLNVNSMFQSKTIEQLTSGFRINKSGDDATGLAVANGFRSTVAELSQGVANGNNAVAQLQIMDGGMSNISTILDRLKTLATQSASGTLNDATRQTLNSEFQTDIAEIDRQAQSIGLNTGGTFAKSLDIYLGQGSGSQNLANGGVTMNLTTATTDSQSLGLKGMQATLGAADLSGSSATSVANILANATNAAAENQGSTIFQFSGPGFSQLAISVNTSGVSDLSGLVNNINAAIQAAGNGVTSAAASFKSAGIVASVNTAANGAQQLAFSSNTTAFQVQAGDRMANALMGNFSSGTTGASLATTVTGQAANLGQNLGASQKISIQFTGAAFGSSPQTLSVTQGVGGIATSTDAINAFIADVNNGVGVAGAAIKAAGITAALGGAGNNQLIFTNANNQAFQVLAGGDTSNYLGLGASLLSANAVTYTSIQAANAYDNTGATVAAARSTNAQATMEFSVNGGPAVTLAPIALDGGDATGGTNTSAAVSANGIVVKADGTNSQFNFKIDGKQVNTTLTANANDGAAQLMGSAAATLNTNYVATVATASGSAGTFTTDYSSGNSGNSTFKIGFDGGPLTTIDLNGTVGSSAVIYATAIQTQLTAAFGGKISVSGASGQLVFTTSTKGPSQSIQLAANGSDTTLADLGLTAGSSIGGGGNGGNNSLMVNIDGVSQKVTLTTQDANAGALAIDLQTAITTAFGSAVANVTVGTGGNAGKLILTTASQNGKGSSITLGAATNEVTGLADTTLASLDLNVAGVTGQSYTAQQLATAMNTAIQNAGLATDPTTGTVGTLYTPGVTTAAATVTVNASNQIVITNNLLGADHSISQVLDNLGAASTGWNSGTAGGNLGANADGVNHLALGTNRTLANLVTAINGAIDSNTTLSAAGIQASTAAAGTKLVFSSSNQTSFQFNAGASAAKGAATGSVDLTSGIDFSKAPVTLKLTTDGGVTTQNITLQTADNNAGAIVQEINNQLTGATASLVSVNGKNYLQIADNNAGPNAAVTILTGSANAVLGLTAGTYKGADEVDLGFGSVSNQTFAGSRGISGAVSQQSGVNASGSSQTGGITFSAIAQGQGTQALTISANNSSGAMQTTTITLAALNSGTPSLANDGSASSIDRAVAYINQQLQKTDNATLQSIVAVQQNVNGTQEINFLSPLSTFQVAVGTGSSGLNGGTAETATSAITGTGSSISISTQDSAQAAITAITAAVSKLGAAQAVVGKGENQLSYAISLAQSQITNFSAAESQIRDADVASQAANLTKAQVLQQASIAAMAQANAAPQAILKLLG